MALFFLVVGLEIKREIVAGQLATWERRRLPFIAAAAGMAVPAAVYLLLVGGDAALRPGWAIPAATDIAFALGVLALLGPRVPPALKLLLATVAIVDDMGAVAIVALVYTQAIDVAALAGAARGCWRCCSRSTAPGSSRLAPYLLLGALLWWLVLRSGVHATVAGVLLAAFVPMTGGALARLEHALHPWSAFVVVPLFSFANAGVALGGLGWDRLAVAVAAGLFLGKQAGILGGIALADRLGIARPPAGVTWMQWWGMALVGGHRLHGSACSSAASPSPIPPPSNR
ncbi:Na+/H+ antiporter NhaA [Sphingomonas sp. MMS24-JH45]